MSNPDADSFVAPTYDHLPTPRRTSHRGGPSLSEVSVQVEVVTPILGGGSQTRSIDDVDVIRPATVRGHLRFWWRALHGHQFHRPADLYAAESALWGRAATDEGGRSAVEIRIDVNQAGGIDDSDIHLQQTPGAYALWPARAETRQITKRPAPRRKPGTSFTLTLAAPEDSEAAVRNAVRAWLLFGGYGSRTRRGLGGFTVLEDMGSWLPASATRDALTTLFGRDVLASPGRVAVDVPWLAGASLQVGGAETNAIGAWTIALDWLKDFRQGTSGQPGARAREPGTGKPQAN
ncbi:MAG: type III-B CRISPR module RAMP protein Cmr1, partial [Methanobacteriota archaeon]